MSKVFKNVDGKLVSEIDNFEKCKFMYDEVCCNDSSPFIADYPEMENCKHCIYFEKENKRER